VTWWLWQKEIELSFLSCLDAVFPLFLLIPMEFSVDGLALIGPWVLVPVILYFFLVRKWVKVLKVLVFLRILSLPFRLRILADGIALLNEAKSPSADFS